MIQRISLFAMIGLLTVNIAGASFEEEATEEKVGKLNPVINRDLVAYLENAENPKLLLGCGHNGDLDREEFKVSRLTMTPMGQMKATSNLFKQDVEGSLAYHAHDGWYTVDKDSRLKPDVCGDLSWEETQKVVLKPNTYELIYLEWLDLEVTSSKLLERILPSLKKGGSLILTLPLMLRREDNKLGLTKSAFQGPFGMQPDKTLGPLWLEFKERYNTATFDTLERFQFCLNYMFRAIGFEEVKCYPGNYTECMGYKATVKHGMPAIPVGKGDHINMERFMSSYRPVGNRAASQLDRIFSTTNLGFFYLIAKK